MELTLGQQTFNVETLAKDDCTSLDHWLSESSGTVEAGPEGLLWNCDAATLMGTIWYDQPFEGPTIVEYDVVSLRGMDNINMLFYAQAPGGLLETSSTRDGTYAQYQSFQNYIITYLVNDEPHWRVRFRKDPGFNLLLESNIEQSTEQGVKRRVSYVFDANGRMALYDNGRLLLEYTDEDNPYRSGYHGFRTWNSVLQYSNFRVLKIL